MKPLFAVRGLLYLFWNKNFLAKELHETTSHRSTNIILYLILGAIAILWHNTGADVITRHIIESGSLTPTEAMLQAQNGTEYLRRAMRIQYLVWDGGGILFRPLVITFIVLAIGRRIRDNFAGCLALSMVLYGEVAVGLGHGLQGIFMALADNPRISFSLLAFAHVFRFELTPASAGLINILNPFIWWEIMIIKSGLSAALELPGAPACKIALVAVLLPRLMAAIFLSW